MQQTHQTTRNNRSTHTNHVRFTEVWCAFYSPLFNSHNGWTHTHTDIHLNMSLVRAQGLGVEENDDNFEGGTSWEILQSEHSLQSSHVGAGKCWATSAGSSGTHFREAGCCRCIWISVPVCLRVLYAHSASKNAQRKMATAPSPLLTHFFYQRERTRDKCGDQTARRLKKN